MSLLTRDLVCRDAVKLATDYLEGALSWRQRRRFEAHLRNCPNCSAYLEQLRASIAATGKVETESLPEETRDELMKLFQRYHGRDQQPGL